jgi:hypothetical protein
MQSKPGKRERRPLNWDDERLQMALTLRFEGRLSSQAIADRIAKDCQKSVSARTLRDWMEGDEFRQKLAAMRDKLLDACDTLGVVYVRKEQRVVGLAQMAEQARLEFEARPWLKEVRPTQDGEITNESFNRDAHAAFRGALDDIAKELGERKNVTELSGKDGKPIEIRDARQRLAARLAALAERRRASGGAEQPE